MQKATLFILIAAILYGNITVGGQFFKELGFSLFEISFFILLSGSLVMSVVVFFKREYSISRDMLSFFVVYGLINTLLQVSSFGAIVLGAPVAVAVLLLYTEPLWTMLFAKPLLGEKITKTKGLSILISLVGILVIVNPGTLEQIENPLSIVLALLSGIFMSLWVIFSRESDLHRQHPVTTTFGSMVFSLPWVLVLFCILSVISPDSPLVNLSFDFAPVFLLYFPIFVIIAYILPGFLFYRGLNYVSASRAAVMMPLEPISSIVLAALLFGQQITSNIVFGGLLILLANYVMSYGKN